MQAIRIKLRQTQANYRKEETVDNKMTYPLPPASTVMGALYSACGYSGPDVYKNHPIDVSIQGKYGSMQCETYKDYAFLNSTMIDRGILVKMRNPKLLSGAYEVVAEALSQGADFTKESKIKVINRSLLDEYQKLREERQSIAEEKKESFNPQVKEINGKIKEKKNGLKNLKKGTRDYENLSGEILLLQKKLKKIKDAFSEKENEIESRYGKFATLVKSQKFYEVLYDVELVIHVRGDKETLQDIMDHVYDIKSIGRSEDFVDVMAADWVKLQDSVEDEVVNTACDEDYCGYVSCKAVEDDIIYGNEKEGISALGTKYLLNKDYQIKDEKRVFHKVWVLYTSDYCIDENLNDDVFYDGKYIVSFI